MAEGKYVLSDVLGAEADSCAGESQVHSGMDGQFSHSLPCDLLPADGAAGMMGGPRAFPLHTALGKSGQGSGERLSDGRKCFAF